MTFLYCLCVLLWVFFSQGVEMQKNTLGVLTKCDLKVSETGRTRGVDVAGLTSMMRGQGEVKLDPHGFVGVVNNTNPDLLTSTTRRRLVDQSTYEVGFFRANGMEELVTERRAGTGALVSRLNEMYLSYLKSTWFPKTMDLLREEKENCKREYNTLGLPVCVVSTPEVIRQVRQTATPWLHTFLSTSLFQEVYALMRDMLKQIVAAVGGSLDEWDEENWISIAVEQGCRHEEECLDSVREKMLSIVLLYVKCLEDMWFNRLGSFLDEDFLSLQFCRFPRTIAAMQSSFHKKTSAIFAAVRDEVKASLITHFAVPGLWVRFVHGESHVQMLVDASRIGNDLVHLVAGKTSPLLEHAFRNVCNEVFVEWETNEAEIEECIDTRHAIEQKIVNLDTALEGIADVFKAV